MAGTRQGRSVGASSVRASVAASIAALTAVLLSGALCLPPAALAQPVPLPTPAPQPKEGAKSGPAAGSVPVPPAAVPSGKPGTPTASAPAPAASGPSSWLNQLLGAKPEAKPADTGFDAKQRALVNKVSAYLSSVQVLNGDFVQIGPDGRRSQGGFVIQKPGKVRFEYAPPSQIDIVADGQSVVVRDRKLETQDLYPLSQTPLRFLLSDKIDLLRDTNVVGVSADDAYVTVIVEEKQVLIGTSRLMMMFDAKDYKLRQWTVTDPQGFDTTIAVSNLDTSKRPDPDLFYIDHTRYVQ